MPVLKDCKILALQIANQVSFFVASHHVDQHQLGGRADGLRCLRHWRLLSPSIQRLIRECGERCDGENSAQLHAIPLLKPEARNHSNAPHAGCRRNFTKCFRIHRGVQAGELHDVENVAGLQPQFERSRFADLNGFAERHI